MAQLHCGQCKDAVHIKGTENESECVSVHNVSLYKPSARADSVQKVSQCHFPFVCAHLTLVDTGWDVVLLSSSEMQNSSKNLSVY